MKIKVAEVKVGTRFRKDFGDIEELADSLSRYGQLQPIILDENNELIAGERRLRAAMSLGLEDIDATYQKDLDEVVKKEIELEENIKRKAFNWPEEILALEKLYAMRKDRYGSRIQGLDTDGYGVKDASEELDRSLGSVSMDLALAKGLHEFPELVNEKSKSSAFKRYKILKETRLRRELASRTRPTDNQEEVEPTEADEESDTSPTPTQIRKAGFKGHGIIYYGDSRLVLRDMPESTVDCLITDPPFALGMYRTGEQHGDRRLVSNIGKMYDDDPHKVLDCIDQIIAHCSRVLKPDGHGYIFFHHNRYNDILEIIERHFGDAVETTPIIWIKNTSGVGDPNRSWVYAYEPCFFINRGRSLVKPQAFNYIRHDTVPPKDKTHPTEKPTSLLRHLVSASCVPGEVVLDPFAGSGSTLEAAVQQGCRFIGCEAIEDFYARIVDRMALVIGEIDASTKPNNVSSTTNNPDNPTESVAGDA